MNYFHWFFGFFGLSLFKRNKWRQGITDDVSMFYFQPILNRLFNNCIMLYWYCISSPWNMKGEREEEIRFTSPTPRKLLSKSPALLRLNLINLWIFFKSNPLFNTCFKFLIWMKYSVLSCKLVISFLTFQFSFFQVNMVNHYQVHILFWAVGRQLKDNIVHRFLRHRFLWNLH